VKFFKHLLRFLAVVALAGSSMSLFFFTHTTDDLSVSEYTLSSSKLTKAYTLVQISDFHNHSLDYANANLLDTIDSYHPDFVVSTGDLIDNHTTDENFQHLRTMFNHFSDRGYPVYFVSGNHEAVAKGERTKNCFALMEEAGAKKVEGFHEKIDDHFYLSGIRDPYYVQKENGYIFDSKEGDIPEQLAHLDEGFSASSFNLLLCHEPQFFPKFKEHGYDLTLAGHTHGGQCLVADWPVLTWGIPYPRYIAGEYEEEGKTLIISRGLGYSYSYPARYHCDCEVVVAHLLPAEK
jgi:predicted MPP superfamily phosphohydrolase